MKREISAQIIFTSGEKQTRGKQPTSLKVPTDKQKEGTIRVLEALGFEVRDIGPTLTVLGNRHQFETTLSIAFSEEHGEFGEYLKPIGNPKIPAKLSKLNAEIVFPEPPQLF